MLLKIIIGIVKRNKNISTVFIIKLISNNIKMIMVEKENSKRMDPKLMERVMASNTFLMKKKELKKHDWSKLIGIINLDESSDCVKEHDTI